MVLGIFRIDKKGLGKKTKGNTRTWHFKAPKVHDFAWAADKDFIHDTYTGANGVILNFYYKNDPEIIENWKQLQEKTAQLLVYFNKHVGDYPYKQYSVIQGGDGGMEYAMCTLITGKRKLGSLIGVTAHELAHTWFQFLLATNESKHEWMDEGFTSYISNLAMNEIMKEGKDNPNSNSYRGYNYIATSGKEQPQSTQADRYTTNTGYGVAAYSKGAVFLSQLEYVIGKDNLNKTLLRYYKEWAFKHPTPNDFIRVAEKVSGAELDWYLTDWTQTTNTIDYGIKNIVSEKEKTGYTFAKLAWAKQQEEAVWKFFIENELLYSTDTKLNKRFIEDAPFSKFYTAQDNQSPGKIGSYIGWQIVRSFMKQNDVSLQKLIAIDAQSLLDQSKYKPQK